MAGDSVFAVVLAGCALNATTGRFVPLEADGEVTVFPTWESAFRGARECGLPLTADWQVVAVPG